MDDILRSFSLHSTSHTVFRQYVLAKTTVYPAYLPVRAFSTIYLDRLKLLKPIP